MAAKRKPSGLGEHPASGSPDALLSADTSLATILAGLEGLEVEGLRRQWRNHLGGEAPAHLPRWLLVKVFGHRLQIAAFGLDKPVRRLLRDETDGEGGQNIAPFNWRDAQTRDGIALRPGALLVREWQGKLERVMVLEEGFAWNGKNFGSLSQIAKAMTGTNWNGHRFFGLRAPPAKRAAIHRMVASALSRAIELRAGGLSFGRSGHSLLCGRETNFPVSTIAERLIGRRAAATKYRFLRSGISVPVSVLHHHFASYDKGAILDSNYGHGSHMGSLCFLLSL
jgi:hypothetical protein